MRRWRESATSRKSGSSLEVRLEGPPQLADFALWVSACVQALGMKLGEAI